MQIYSSFFLNKLFKYNLKELKKNSFFSWKKYLKKISLKNNFYS